MPLAQFIESIRLLDGKPQLLNYHKERVERSLREHSARPFFCLDEYVHRLIEEFEGDLQGVYKLRFEYNLSQVYNPSIRKYEVKRINKLYPYPIESLDCYRYKYSDRSILEHYILDKRVTPEGGQEVLPIFCHQGLLTDTPYSNIVLDMGDGVWLTPLTPLLNGVMRQHLLNEGLIREARLTEQDLEHCYRFRLINALLPLML